MATKRAAEIMENLLQDAHGGTGQHFYRRCPVCGEGSWVSSRPEGEPAFVNIDLDTDNSKCALCQLVNQRWPEMVPWVLACLDMAFEKQEARDIAKAEEAIDEAEEALTPPAPEETGDE